MSQTIDSKVVEMKFDNSNFESNVKQSQQTLENLKKDLKLEASTEGFKQISDAVKGVSFEGMTKGINEVKAHFSALEVVAVTALANITSKAVDAGLSMAKSLSIDLATDGFSQYERKTQSVQTIMNATGKDIDSVNEALDRLIWFADETSYSFGDMVDNVGKFTSVGVDLDVASKAMMGISNWAAVSGQNATTATRAMYNLSQAMGLGYVGLMDWKSIELANMATSEFKQQVIDTAVAMGKLNKGQVTTQNFRESLKDKWFDNDVLLSVLGKYGDYTELVYNRVKETGELCAVAMDNVSRQMGDSYDKIGEKALRAAQEAKTFHEAIDATKDAVKSQWGTLFESAFGNYDEARVTFTNLANSLWTVFAEPLSNFNETVAEAMSAKTIDVASWNEMAHDLRTELGLTGTDLTQFQEVIKQVAKESGVDIDAIIQKNYGSFESSLIGGWLNTDLFQKAVARIKEGVTVTGEDALASVQDVVNKIWSGEIGTGEDRRKTLEELGYDYDEIQALVELGYGAEITLDDLGEKTKAFFATTGEGAGSLKEALDKADTIESFKEIAQYMSGAELRNGIWTNLFGAEEGSEGALITYVTAIREAFSSIFGTLESGTIHDFLVDLYARTSELLNEERVAKFKTTVENLFHGIHAGIEILKGVFSVIKSVYDNTLGPLISGLWNIVKSIASGIGGLFAKFDEGTGSLTIFSNAIEWINKVLAPLKNGITTVTNGIVKFINALFSGASIGDAFEGAVSWIITATDKINGVRKAAKFKDIMDNVRSLGSTISETFSNIGKRIGEFWTAFQNTELGQGITRVVERIKTALSGVWSSISNWFKNLFKPDSDGDFNFFEGIQNALDRFNTWLNDLDFTEGLEKVSDFVVSVKDHIKSAFSSIGNWFQNNETIQGAISTVRSKFGELRDAIFNGGDDEDSNEPKKPFLTRVLEAVGTIIDWAYEHLPSLSDVITIITGILGGSAMAGLLTTIIRIKNMFSGGAGIVTNFSKVLSGISLALKTFSLQMVGSAIWDMAKSFALVFGVLVAGLVALSFVDSDKLATVGLVLIGLGAGITVLAKAMSGIIKSMLDNRMSNPKKLTTALSEGIGSIAQGVKNYLTITAYSSAILKVGVAIALLSASMLMLSKLSWEDCAKGLATIGALLAEIMLTFKLMGGKKMLVDLNVFIGLAGAIMAFVNSFKDIAKYDWDEILKGIVTIGAILLELSMFTSLGKDMRVSTGISMIAIGAAMLIFVQTIKQISQYTPEALTTSIVAIGAIMAEMVMASTYSKSVGIGGMATMLVLASTMLIFCRSIKQLSGYSWDQLLVSILAMAAVMAELVGFARLISGVQIKPSALVMLAELALVIPSIVGSLAILSHQQWDKLLIAIGAMAAVLGGIILFAKGMATVNLTLKQGVAIAAISAAVTGFAVAIALLATIPWQQLVASAAAIAGVLLSIAGAAALLSVVRVNIDSIANVLVAMAALIAAVAGAIWLVVNALDGADLENVKVNLGEIVTDLVSNLIQAITGSAGAIVQGLIDMLGTLVESAPQMVDMLIQLVISVLNALTERMPELATAIAGFVKSLIDSFCEAFADVDLTPLVNLIQNLIIGVGAIVLLGKFGGFGAALKGLGMFSLVVTGIIALFTGFAALMAWVDGDDGVVSNFLAKGFQGLTVIAQGIGDFVGTLIGSLAGSAAESFSSSLPGIGTNLSTFMENVQGFLDGASKIDSNFLASIGNLSLAMMEISGANFVTSITDGLSWLIGGTDTAGFVGKFVELGNGLSAFADSISGVDFSTVENASNAAAVITALSNVVPREGGLWQKIVGEQDFANVDTNFANLGSGVASFCSSISGVTLDATTEAAVTSAANVIATLMEKGVQSTGGLWQKIVGEKDMANAGTNFTTLGEGVAAFCDSISGVTIDADAESAATSAANVIATLMEKGVQSTGGLWQKIVGEKDMANAGDNFKNLGEGVSAFCDAISGTTITADEASAASSAADIINNLMAVVPNEGGLWQKIVGEKDMDNAGTNFENIGKGVAAFCDELDGITIDADSASSAASVISTLMEVQPTEGGLWQKIVGEKDPSSAPDNFKNIGEGVANFCDAVSGHTMDDSSVSAAAACAGIIRVFSNVVPATGGLWQDIVGETDLSKTGQNLGDLGSGISAYITATDGVTKASVVSGKIAAQGMIDIINLDWPTETGLLGWIANGIAGGETNFDTVKIDLEKIGEMCKTLCTSFTEVGADTVTNAKTAAQGVIDIFNLEWPSTDTGLFGWIANLFTGGDTNFTTLGTRLGDIATMLTTFATNLSGLNANTTVKISLAQAALQGIISMFDLVPETIPDLSTLPTAIGYLIGSVKNFASPTFDLMKVYLVVAAVRTLMDLLNDMSGVDFDSASGFSDALGTLAESGIEDFNTAFSDAQDATVQTVTDFVTAVATAMSVPDDFTTSGDDDASGFNDGFSAWQETITALATTIVEAAATNMDREWLFWTSAVTCMQGFQDGLNSQLSNVTTLAYNISGEAGESTNRYWAFWTNGVSCIQGFVDGMNAMLGSATSTAYNIGGESGDSTNRYWSFWTSGTYCITGFIDGMNAYAVYAYNAAATIGYGVVATYNRSIGAESPAKEFIKSGMYSDMGIAKGLTDYSYIVNEASSDVAEGSLETIKSALQGINTELIDEAPTIRPVLDLSDIQNGANSINDLLYAEGSMRIGGFGVGGVARVINDLQGLGVTGLYDDTDVIAVINDLGERVDNLNNSINNIKLYLNGKDLVGGIVTDMDNALGTLSTKKKKGVL